MNLYKKVAILIILISVFFAGCISSRIYPGGMMDSSVNMKGKKYEVIGNAKGQSSNFNLFWFIPVTDKANIDRAITSAITEKNGDQLINIRWYKEKKIYILGTVSILHVEGIAVRLIENDE